MRLNIDNVDPKTIGLIYEDKARHKHSTLADTIECLVKRAMQYEPHVKTEQNLAEMIENSVRKVLGEPKSDIVIDEKEMVQ